MERVLSAVKVVFPNNYLVDVIVAMDNDWN